MNLQNNFCTNCGANLSAGSKFCGECGVKVAIKNKEVSQKSASEKRSVKLVDAGRPEPRAVGAGSLDYKQPKSWDDYFEIKNHNIKKGLQLWFCPIIAIIIFGILASVSGDGGVSMFFVILAGLSSVAMLVGFILGIYFWSRKIQYPDEKYDQSSGQGSESEVPKEILGFNYGAVGLGFIWGCVYRVFIIPIFIVIANIIIFLISLGSDETALFWHVMICLAYLMLLIGFGNGIANQFAWRNNRWPSVKKFLDVQKKWRIWGIVAFWMMVLALVMNLSVAVMKNKVIGNVNDIELKYGKSFDQVVGEQLEKTRKIPTKVDEGYYHGISLPTADEMRQNIVDYQKAK